MTNAELIEAANRMLAESVGMQYHSFPHGLSQRQIYELAGRYDNVVTLQLREESSSADLFGKDLTVCFIYTQNERRALEEDPDSLEGEPCVKAKDLLNKLDEDKRKLVETKGIKVSDIVELTIAPTNKEFNTFPSRSLRELNSLNVEFEPYGNGEDITWMYGFLHRMKERGIALTPEENADYLAYKLVLDKQSMTEKEKMYIFDGDGNIKAEDVAFSYLLWKEQAHLLKGSDVLILKQLKEKSFLVRFGKTGEELKKMGLSWKKLAQISPQKSILLFNKIAKFHEVRYNITGKYLLYSNFETLLHVYLRHVQELRVPNQFENRDKFQLHEEDVMKVMEHVMIALNDEYQAYKEANPNGRFYRAGKMAYYFNGDYYNVNVNADGSVSTFYKASGNKK